MKRKITALILTICFMGAAALAPSILVGMLPTVTVTRTEQSQYRASVQCDGTVALTDVSSIYLQFPVVAKSIDVKPGDYVVKGQRLFTIDKDATVSAITQALSQSAAIPAFLNLEGLAEALGSTLTNSGAFDFSAIPDAVYSTETGYVRELNVSTSSLFNYTQPAATVSEEQRQIIKLNVPENIIYQISVGDEAQVIGNNGADETVSGRVTRVAETAVTVFSGLNQTKAVETIVTLDAKNHYINGTTVKVTIFTEEARTIVSVPYEAVDQNEQGEEFVRCVENGKVVFRTVTTGSETETGFEVLEGLTGGETLVLNGQDLNEGQMVLCRWDGETP